MRLWLYYVANSINTISASIVFNPGPITLLFLIDVLMNASFFSQPHPAFPLPPPPRATPLLSQFSSFVGNVHFLMGMNFIFGSPLKSRTGEEKKAYKDRRYHIAVRKNQASTRTNMEEELPKGSIAVKVDSQRHGEKRSRGKDSLAQSQNKAGAGPHGPWNVLYGHMMKNGCCWCCCSCMEWDRNPSCELQMMTEMMILSVKNIDHVGDLPSFPGSSFL